MRSTLAAFVALVCLFTFHNSAQAQQPQNPKAARIALVREFLREIESLYNIQQKTDKELADAPSTNDKLVTNIRNGTRTLLAMNEGIARLNMIDMITVSPTWAKFRNWLIYWDQQRIGLVRELVAGSKAFLEAPQRGVNYGALVARAPEITTEIEAVDKTIFKMSQVMFFMLVDDSRVGSDGNVHHLIVTKEQRASIVHEIDTAFGASVDDKNAPYIVSAAWVLKEGLTRSKFKAADEP